ncbi:SIS domain-containing protein [Mycolicibacterium diernhoferi]|uniref:Glutamine--fructose-6-phosphate aminotransferase [isomerizing] n=1 Tax=Mycolicibacterium diernhoferi TaxID=1801 RepID=A0A1Q4H7G2_9MYCO|nr:SIS domain-containing protein [Mycolicibacterium diernhoferi]OJZ63405.1 iron dicitrate transport regulator FecR [Mycolicibacterium diernhoferi]OPE47380.1 iron dicitrate transport regulator FecR [Mycolicibacterium diernhoferi]PEG54017.1 SIS domain-containing protein [Mycolicibacterium diernhoferi]QYL20546.1 SIS domain-containing protein [Mycolicibacterium diernhoferi]
MNPDGFASDLARKPDVLTDLADALAQRNPWAHVVPGDTSRVVFLGMGSSAYAAGVAAARLRARGICAVSEIASSQLLPHWGPGTLVVATSASGGSVETLDALGRVEDSAYTVALTNTPGSAITAACEATVELLAEPEVGGVACRSYQHTLALLMALECHLTGTPTDSLVESVAAAARASDHLLRAEKDWLPEVSDLLLGRDETHLVAPAHRLSSAQQGALMFREGPRRSAIGCESGDWSHVDVYRTKNSDLRMLVFAGSAWEAQMAEWTGPRGTTVVGVGGEVPTATATLRYPGDDADDVRLLTETLIPELVAARDWQAAAAG